MRSALLKLAAACTALPLAVTLAAAPTAAQAGPCVRMLSVEGTNLIGREGTLMPVSIVDMSENCAGAGTVSLRAEPTVGPNGQPETPNDNDYDGSTQVIEWTEHSPVQQRAEIAIYADGVNDPNEFVAVRLFNWTGDVRIVNDRQVGRLPELREQITDIEYDEYGCMIGACLFRVRMRDVVSFPTELYWETLDGTAKGGRDFDPVTAGRLVIKAGERFAVGHIKVLARGGLSAAGGPAKKGDPYFRVRIYKVSKGEIGRATCVMTLHR